MLATNSIIIKAMAITILVGVMASCGKHAQEINEVYFSENSIVYDRDAIEISDTLTGEIIIPECMGAIDLSIVDTVMCISTRGYTTLFELRNLNGDSLTSICVKGNGPNDLTSTMTNGVKFQDESGSGLWVVDVGNAQLKRLNISESIKRGEALIDQSYRINPMVKFAAVVGDSMLQEIMDDDIGFRLRISESADIDNVIADEPMYKIAFDDMGDCFSAYNSPLSVSPDGRYIVIAMRAINQVNIHDLKDSSKKTVSIGNVAGVENLFGEYSLPYWTYYSDIELTDNLIFALYINHIYDRPDDFIEPPSELHVFDYSGCLKCIIPLDRYIRDISFSKYDGYIYALTFDEEILRYKPEL